MLKMLSICFGGKKKEYTHIPEKSGQVSKDVPGQITESQNLGQKDDKLWHFPLSKTSSGEFSFAVVQANVMLEDQAQVESISSNTLIGVHDGHGGHQAAKFVNERFYHQLQRVLEDAGGVMSVEVIRKAYVDIEAEFLELVRGSWKLEPQMAAVGTCSLVGVVSRETLYVASLGDSRAVLGTHRKGSGIMTAVQLSVDHNANYQAIRQELKMRYPQDKDVVVQKEGVWRVKGIIQVSRAIGDVYLKSQEFQADPLIPRFRLSEPLTVPVLLAEPTVIVRSLQPLDKFVIFASDGLWEHITNQEAVNIVFGNPRAGIAQRLIVAALTRAAKKRDMTYPHLKFLEVGKRRQVHDDISVIVFYFNHGAQEQLVGNRQISIKSCQSEVGQSNEVL